MRSHSLLAPLDAHMLGLGFGEQEGGQEVHWSRELGGAPGVPPGRDPHRLHRQGGRYRVRLEPQREGVHGGCR